MIPGEAVLVAATDDERIARPDFRARLESLLAAGCDVVWLRAPSLGGGPFLALARDTATRCAAHDAELWVGDRADVARLAGAHAVQLPEGGLSIAGARRAAGPGIAIGRSVHSAPAALEAAREGADRIVLGTIFPSGSHPGAHSAGASLVSEACAALAAEGRSVPVIAIGGMTPARAGEAMAAGAAGVAAIRALWDAPDPADAVRAFRAVLRPRAG